MKGIRTVQIIWAALVGGVVFYTLVAWAMVRAGVGPSSNLDPSLLNIMAAGVLVYMVAGVFVRRSMLARVPRDGDPQARLAAYQTATIVGLALTESGGLILVTLGFVSGAPGWILAGGMSAAVLMFMARPTEDDFGGS